MLEVLAGAGPLRYMLRQARTPLGRSRDCHRQWVAVFAVRLSDVPLGCRRGYGVVGCSSRAGVAVLCLGDAPVCRFENGEVEQAFRFGAAVPGPPSTAQLDAQA